MQCWVYEQPKKKSSKRNLRRGLLIKLRIFACNLLCPESQRILGAPSCRLSWNSFSHSATSTRQHISRARTSNIARRYKLITGTPRSGQANWQSLRLLHDSGVDYECRTTVHWQLFDSGAVLRLAYRLARQGVRRFTVQLARPARMLDPTLGLSTAPPEAASLWLQLHGLFERFELREA